MRANLAGTRTSQLNGFQLRMSISVTNLRKPKNDRNDVVPCRPGMSSGTWLGDTHKIKILKFSGMLFSPSRQKTAVAVIRMATASRSTREGNNKIGGSKSTATSAEKGGPQNAMTTSQ